MGVKNVPLILTNGITLTLTLTASYAMGVMNVPLGPQIASQAKPLLSSSP